MIGRMKRVAHYVLLLLSLLCSMTIAYLWIRNDQYSDHADYYSSIAMSQRTKYVSIHSANGSVELRCGVATFTPEWQGWSVHSWTSMEDGPGRQTATDYLQRFRRITFVGFGFKLDKEDYFVALPYWFLMSLVLALPIWELARWRKIRRRRAKGLCLQCGYDLRASSGRCPECGLPIPPGVAA